MNESDAGAGIGAIWLILVLVIWVGGAVLMYKDAEKRGASGGLWAFIWLLFGIIGAIIWLIVRKPVQPPAPAYQPMAPMGPGMQAYQSASAATAAVPGANPLAGQPNAPVAAAPVDSVAAAPSPATMPSPGALRPDAAVVAPAAPSLLVFCENCGRKNDPPAPYCAGCGASTKQA